MDSLEKFLNFCLLYRLAPALLQLQMIEYNKS